VNHAQRDWYVVAQKPAPELHLAHPQGRAALLIVLVTVPRVSRSCEHFGDAFDLHLLNHEHKHRSLAIYPGNFVTHSPRIDDV